MMDKKVFSDLVRIRDVKFGSPWLKRIEKSFSQSFNDVTQNKLSKKVRKLIQVGWP